MSTTSSRRSTQAGSARGIAIVLVALVMFAAGVGTTWWYLTQRTSAPVASATPAPDFGPLTPSPLGPEVAASGAPAAPEPEPPAAVADATVPAGPPAAGGPARPARRIPRPGPTAAAPAPTLSAPQLVAQAEAAAAQKRFADASDLYEQALKVDPKSAPALAGRQRIAAMGATRTFVLGRTVVESLKPVESRDLAGFDTAGIGVKRAPSVKGQLELVMEPARLNAGEPYAVKVFLRNEGKKAIEVDELKVSMIVDGKASMRPLPPKVKQVAPRQRMLIEELPGIWRAGVSDWAVEAVVTSKVRDVYRNRLTWK